jgi:hypothetical protein
VQTCAIRGWPSTARPSTRRRATKVGGSKITGRAARTDSGYRVDIDEVALTYLDGGLVIQSWHPGRGHEKVTRD